MRLKQYILNEENIIKTVLPFILDNCKPFLKELTRDLNNFNFMYSGRMLHKESYFIGSVRKNRKPLSSSNKMHDRLDIIFKKKFGWKARSNVIFCTGSMKNAAGYSDYDKVYMIFPIGEYKYLWSPKVEDMYTMMDGELKPEGKTFISMTYDREIQQYIHKKMDISCTMKDIKRYKEEIINKIIKDNTKYNIKKYEKLIDTYKSTGLNKALRSGNEIMVNCKTYYAVNSIYDGGILNYLLEYGLSKEGLDTINET